MCIMSHVPRAHAYASRPHIGPCTPPLDRPRGARYLGGNSASDPIADALPRLL